MLRADAARHARTVEPNVPTRACTDAPARRPQAATLAETIADQTPARAEHAA
jgi:hypothetical protein